MYLKRIKIKNFRSLEDVEIWPMNYTVLVGPNDSGKSNVLRALNLFFNQQTDVGQSLVFDQDYSQQAVTRVNRAKQIEIELEFQPPSNYTDNQPVIWKKAYRKGRKIPYSEELFVIGGKPLRQRTKTEYWVRQISYEYVPAIRGKEFFATLKRRLHNTLAETIAPRLASASGDFLGNIRREVDSIEHEALRLFDLTTEFSLPADLGSFFETLDFKTADAHAATPLQNRGDGIQGRHIPVILRFLAEQRKTNFARGKPPPETLWGYEEPENNLELAKQIEEADEFLRSSNSIQLLITTHSPAFYGVAKNHAWANIWFAQRSDGRTEFQRSSSTQNLDKSLGLMPFVEPYLQKAVDERNQLQASIKKFHAQSLHLDRAVLCLEGATDKVIFDSVFKVLFGPSSLFEIVAKPNTGGGVGWVYRYAIARSVLPDLNMRTVALFDDDEGNSWQTKLTSHLDVLSCRGRVQILNIGMKKTDEVLRVVQAGVQIPIALEEICGEDAWNYAESKGWLEERKGVIPKNSVDLSPDGTFKDWLNGRLTENSCRRLVLRRVKKFKKMNFAKYVASEIDKSQTVPPTLEKLANHIHGLFSNT
jgi:energy-coupling factor transporter ATP-binding protein EcfA2